jgi:exonuclease III
VKTLKRIKTGSTTLFYSGTNNGRHENGVGFMINEKILHNTKSFTPVNDRICYIKISGRHFDLILINCYAPTKDKADDIKEKFYDELETVMNSLPTHSLKMIVGDFNAKIGRENIYRPIIGPNSLHEISNDNGTKLIHFASSQELTISQGRTELIFQAGNFFLPGQKLIGDQRFGHKCAK